MKLYAKDQLRCSDGFQLVERGTKLKVEAATVQCGLDGNLTGLDKFQCLRSCGTYDGLWGAATLGHSEQLAAKAPVSSLNAVAGDTIRLSCPAGTALVGSEEVTCSDAGTFVAPSRGANMPLCFPSCELGVLGKGLVVQQRTVASPELLASSYGPQIRKDFGKSPAQGVLVGGKLHFGCQKKCLALPAELSCGELGQFFPPTESLKCACAVSIQIHSMEISDTTLQTDVKYMKLQVFEGPLSSDKLLSEARKKKQYLAAEKFAVGKVDGSGGTSLRVSSNLADAVLHLTLCSKSSGPTKSRTSHCRIATETDVQQGVPLGKLLKDSTSAGWMTFSLNWSGYQAEVKFRVALTPE